MRVVEAEERIQPLIQLPPQLSKIAPDCMSDSSGGIVTVDKLEQDKKRLQDTFAATENALLQLATVVRNTGLDISTYPQYEADHINHLNADIETNVD